jgi:signal recognition particle subunit SRP54
MEMIPGMGQIKMPKDALKVQEGKLKSWKYVMQSMTRQEKQEPDIMNSSRIERIAKGSGRKVQDVRDLLKQYRQGKKMMKMFKGKDPEKAMSKLMNKMQK